MDMSNNNLVLDKGQVRKDVSMFAWDSIRECSGEDCPVTEMCTYIKRGKCAVQTKYLDALYKAILTNYKFLDEVMLFKIGMQIVPLYLQLVRMQIIELSLPSPAMYTEKGVSMHPVYKEIRETLKTIHTMWKDLDLCMSFNMKPSFKPEAAGTAETGDTERGDPNYYKSISEGNVSRKGVIR